MTVVFLYDFWTYQILPLFIISKILTIKPIKKKVEDEKPIFLTIICAVMFVVGYLITNLFYQMLSNFYNNNYYAMMIYNPLNVTIFIIQLFNVLKIKIEDKLFTLISIMATIAIVLTINIIPIVKINNIMDFQNKLISSINSNTFTYKNIKNELEPYINGVTEDDTQISGVLFDYQYFEHRTKSCCYFIKSCVQNINKKNFNEYLTRIHTFASAMDFSKVAPNVCTSRIATIIINIILITGMAVFVSKKIYGIIGQNQDNMQY